MLEEIITDNSLAFIEALDWLAEQYRIDHIHISPYNSEQTGPSSATIQMSGKQL
jgi:hypothetical protein